jgi:hypothetical protein
MQQILSQGEYGANLNRDMGSAEYIGDHACHPYRPPPP